ncbi:MAG: ABC transporter substrate-binding protein [Thermoleophilia bacterium]|nr:ABC transporter substrate-binding protein [Thermoleophilia bacterium]
MSRSKIFLVVALAAVLALGVLTVGCGEEETTTTAAPATTGTTASPSSETTAPPASETTAPPTTVGAPVDWYLGGTFALTGAYAEDCAAVLAGYQDYAKWVNDNKMVAPWYPDKTIPTNVTLSVKWGDDALDPATALTLYDQLKGEGLLVERITGSPEGMALKDLLIEDKIGATSQSSNPAYLRPPGNIFTNAPIYTDQMAAVADWFMESWTDTSRKPKVAYLTADSTLGRGIDYPEMRAYLEQIGFEFAGAQFVDMVPAAPPTTQLAWLKDNGVDLTIGCMINPGTQPTIREAVRLGMGPDLDYKITFGFAYPAHLQVFVPAMGAEGNGVVVAGDFCALDADNDGIKLANLMQDTYRPNDRVAHVMYLCGIIEAMTQLEAMRLASMEVDPAELTSADVLEKGFRQIKDFSTGGILVDGITHGPDDPQGIEVTRLQQVQDGKIIELGAYPTRGLIPQQ